MQKNLWKRLNTDLHFFGGSKGGVGKSYVCRTVCQYYLDNDLAFKAFDTDRSNPDLKRCLGHVAPVQLAIFSEGEKYEDTPNAIFNAALKQDTLVNLPAQVDDSFAQWVANNDIFEIARDCQVRLLQWHVSDCGYDSLKLFVRSLERYGEWMPHIFVKNFGMTEDWEAFETDPELQDLVVQYDVKVIEFSKFVGSKTRNAIDENSLSFGEALTWQGFGPIERQRVRSFLRKASQGFLAAEIFPMPAASASASA
jgi:hypothetical protein